MSGPPLVSVLLASRDGARFLPAALASLKAQTWPQVEIVAVDDGSRDETAAILVRFAASHPRMRVLHCAGAGLAAALARAAREAEGEFFARQDDDDLSRPERLERQVTHLMGHPEVAVLGSAAEIVDERGQRLDDYPIPGDPAAIRRLLRRAPPFVHGSVMMRREAYQAAGGYRPAFLASQDYDLWLRLSEDAVLANLPEPLYAWRRHPGSVFARARARQLFYNAVAREFARERRATGRDAVELLERSAGEAEFLAAYPRRGRLLATLGELYVREGRLDEARRLLFRALTGRGGRTRASAWLALSVAMTFTPRAARARAAHRTTAAGPVT